MKRSEETRQRLREAQRKLTEQGRVPSFTGRQHTDETKSAISAKALERAEHPTPCPECDELYPVHNIPHHIKARHTGEEYLSEDGKRRISEAAQELIAKMRWCEECQREWTVLLWPRHIRKYHEGGRW